MAAQKGSIARHVEISADSSQSIDDAIRRGVELAAQSTRGITQFWVRDIVASVDPSSNKITNFRVNGKLSFVLDDR
jgi:dodecin